MGQKKIEKTTNKQRREQEAGRVKWIKKTRGINIPGYGVVSTSEAKRLARARKGRSNASSVTKKIEAENAARKRAKKVEWKQRLRAKIKAARKDTA